MYFAAVRKEEECLRVKSDLEKLFFYVCYNLFLMNCHHQKLVSLYFIFIKFYVTAQCYLCIKKTVENGIS
jgi:hypothetical protein